MQLKSNLAKIVIATCAFGATGGCAYTPVKPQLNDPVVLSEMVTAVQQAIDPFWCPPDDHGVANNACPSGLPPLKQVKLTLQTVRDTKTTGQLDVSVASLQASKESAETQQIDLTLTPNKPPEIVVTGFDHDRFAQLKRDLSERIEAARNSVKKTYSNAGKTLYSSAIDVQVSFAVTWDVKVGASKLAVIFLSASPSFDRSTKAANTIVVSFANPEKK